MGTTAGEQTAPARVTPLCSPTVPQGGTERPLGTGAEQAVGKEGEPLWLPPSDVAGVFHTTSFPEPHIQFCEDSTQACVPG